MPRIDRHFAYLAGLLDGEGNIGVYRSKNTQGYWGYAINVYVSNSDRRLMRYLVSKFGGTFHKAPKAYVWEPNGGKKRAEEILFATLPYLTIKKKQAQTVLSFIDLGNRICPNEREQFYLRTKQLNRCGVPKNTLPTGTKANLAYLAGLLDGEGTIRITKAGQYNCDNGISYNKQISISNCNKGLVRYLRKHFGGVSRPRCHSGNPKHAPSYRWSIFGTSLQESLLLGVLPYLVLKKQQAIKVVEYLRLDGQINPNKRETLYQAVCVLNAPFPSETNTSTCR